MSDDRPAPDADASTVDEKRHVDPFDVVLRELAAAPSPPPAPFEMLEQQRYRILELLGGGGSGQVYRAYDEQLGRHVALKFLNAAGADHAAQLVKEARTQARVQHPSVCQVYEVAESVGRPFIAMQLIEGPTLGAAQITLGEKVTILRQVAEAVEAAHQLGIVHRDLKPANIMLERVTEGWRPYVMDFGLAREVGKTLTSGMVGTPQFMAPEQARGDITSIGPRTDVWALGATLYTLLAGEPPFDGESVMAILRNVETEIAPRLPSVAPELEAITLRCLEKSPERRYASAAALARDLAAFERGDPVTARPPGATRRLWARVRRRAPLVTLGLALVAVALVIGLRPAHPWHAVIRELEPGYEEDAGGVSVSPDGKTLVYAATRSEESALYLQPVEGGPPHRLKGTDGAHDPSWSGDGEAIYFGRRDHDGKERIERMPRDESTPAAVVMAADAACECAGNLFYVRWAVDGVWHLWLREPGKSARELSQSIHGVYEPACSRDGRRLAYWRRAGADDRVAWLDIGDRVEHVLPALGDESLSPTFHPDGKSLLLTVRSGLRYRLWEQSLDGRRSRMLTENSHDGRPKLAPDGRLFFNVENLNKRISARPVDGAAPRHLADGGAWLLSLEPTPDGRELIASRILDDGSPQVVALSVTDGSERVLARGSLPAVSPDGKRVYFVGGEQDVTLWEMAVEGGAARAVVRLPVEIEDLHAAPDALHLTLSGKSLQAWRQPYDGSPGENEGSAGVRLVEPGAGGWRLALTGDGDSILVPSGPWPAVLPEKTRFIQVQVTSDRRGFSGVDESNDAWLIIPGGPERRLIQLGPLVAMMALSPDGKTVYTIDIIRHIRRAELANYGSLPRL